MVDMMMMMMMMMMNNGSSTALYSALVAVTNLLYCSITNSVAIRFRWRGVL